MKKYERLAVIEIDEHDESGYTLISDVVRCLTESMDKGAPLIDIGYLHPIIVREETKEEIDARLAKQLGFDRLMLKQYEENVKELKLKLGL